MSDDAILISGPMEYRPYGKDATCWRWFIAGHEVVVEISNTAMESDQEFLPPQVAEAIESKGRSEIEKLFEWETPPHTIRVSTTEVIFS